MLSITGILGAVIIFGAIIAFHEFGHFVVAKLSGMLVHEFSIGFGPVLLKWKRGDTQYSIRAVPLGGFVRIAGMELGEEENKETSERGFDKKPFYAKFATIAAGAIMNFVLAFLIIIVIGLAIGHPLPGDKVIITGVQPNFPAARAGIQAGDEIVGVAGEENPGVERAVKLIETTPPPVEIVVRRDGELHAYSIKQVQVPSIERDGLVYEMGSKQGIGVGVSTLGGGWQKQSFGDAVVSGVVGVANMLEEALANVVSLVLGKVPVKYLSGPVGIMQVSYESSKNAFFSQWGMYNALNLAVLISVFVGFFNLLPLPALDGGRLLFLAIAAIRGKEFDKEKEAMIHMVGLAVLLGFILLITVKDVIVMAGGGR